MRSSHLVATFCVLAVLPLGIVACGDNGGETSASSGSQSLTIYSSLPRQGESRPQSLSVENGEKLALKEAGNKVGDFEITYKSLDDGTSKTGTSDPGQTATNARKAAQDKSTIAYLGEFNPGASAISIPVLNEVGILQVSPMDTVAGLTRPEAVEKGEPDKYYPSGNLTFARVIPADHVQAAAQVAYQQDVGCEKTFVLNDRSVYGAGLARQFVNAAKAEGLETVGAETIDPDADDYRSLADDVASVDADCVFFGGITQNNAVQLFKDLHAADPRAKLFGAHGVAEPGFLERLGSAVEKVTYITSPALDPKLYPESGQQFFKDYKAAYGKDPGPYAIFGYEAMKAVLQAIADAGSKGNDRQAVIDAFLDIKDRKSVLGTYSIDEYGDTTLTTYGGNRVKGGKLIFDRKIDAQPQ